MDSMKGTLSRAASAQTPKQRDIPARNLTVLIDWLILTGRSIVENGTPLETLRFLVDSLNSSTKKEFNPLLEKQRSEDIASLPESKIGSIKQECALFKTYIQIYKAQKWPTPEANVGGQNGWETVRDKNSTIMRSKMKMALKAKYEVLTHQHKGFNKHFPASAGDHYRALAAYKLGRICRPS